MPAKPSTNKCDKHNSMVNRHIGTAYDDVKLVAENLDEILEVAGNLPYLLNYLGAYASNPTERPNGDPLENGDYYFNTVDDALVYYDLAEDVWFTVDPQEVLNARDEAIAARDAAQLAQAGAEAARDTANTAASNAQSSAIAASNAQTAAETAEANALTSETNAAGSASAAAVSESNAASSAADASASETNAAISESNAATSASEALASENAAESSEIAAANSAVSAAQSAADAEAAFDSFTDLYLGAKNEDPTTDNDGNPLQVGATYWNIPDSTLLYWSGFVWDSPEESAIQAANTAIAARDDAEAAEAAAAGHELAAAASATDAATSEANAANSASSAQSSATTAGNSATTAVNAAAAASTSETNAEAAKDRAVIAETNAEDSELNAATSESNAAVSESNAATSASQAATSASNAATAESGSATNAANAAASASAAATSESNAATSETNAATSETNAATSETNAANSAAASATSAAEAAQSVIDAQFEVSNAQAQANRSEAEADRAEAEADRAEQAGGVTWQIHARNEAEMNQMLEQNEAARAASGFDHYGQHVEDGSWDAINEGLWAPEEDNISGVYVKNTLHMGVVSDNANGQSEPVFAKTAIAGFISDLDFNQYNPSRGGSGDDWCLLKFPEAPNGTVVYDSTGDVRGTGNVTLDLLNEVDPKYGDVAGSLQEALSRASEGEIKNSDFRNGITDGWIDITNGSGTTTVLTDGLEFTRTSSSNRGGVQHETINLVPGQEYTLSFTVQTTVKAQVSFSDDYPSVARSQYFNGVNWNAIDTGRYETTFTATGTTGSLQIIAIATGTVKVTDIRLRRSSEEVVVDRHDVFGGEFFLEEVSQTNPFVYPKGMIQTQKSTMNGIATSRSNRPDSYYSVYDGDTEIYMEPLFDNTGDLQIPPWTPTNESNWEVRYKLLVDTITSNDIGLMTGDTATNATYTYLNVPTNAISDEGCTTTINGVVNSGQAIQEGVEYEIVHIGSGSANTTITTFAGLGYTTGGHELTGSIWDIELIDHDDPTNSRFYPVRKYQADGDVTLTSVAASEDSAQIVTSLGQFNAQNEGVIDGDSLTVVNATATTSQASLNTRSLAGDIPLRYSFDVVSATEGSGYAGRIIFYREGAADGSVYFYASDVGTTVSGTFDGTAEFGSNNSIRIYSEIGSSFRIENLRVWQEVDGTLVDFPTDAWEILSGTDGGGSVGLGVDFWAASDNEKKAMLADHSNNIFLLDDGRVVQWRMRQRTIAGFGNGDWSSIDPAIYGYGLIFKTGSPQGDTAGVQGHHNVPLAYGTAYWTQPSVQGAVAWGFKDYKTPGAYKASGAYGGAWSSGVNGECYFHVWGRVRRLNQGAYHPGFNSLGASLFLDSTGAWDKWDLVTLGYINSTLSCFLKALENSGNMDGNGSGRNDGRYFDAIYAGGNGGVNDDRLPSWDVEGEHSKAILKAIDGSFRGEERKIKWKVKMDTSPSSSSSAIYPASALGVTQDDMVGGGWFSSAITTNPRGRKCWIRITDTGGATLTSGTALDTWYICDVLPHPSQKQILLNPNTGTTRWIDSGSSDSLTVDIAAGVYSNSTVSGSTDQQDVIGFPEHIMASLDFQTGWEGDWIGEGRGSGSNNYLSRYADYNNMSSDIMDVYNSGAAAWTEYTRAINFIRQRVTSVGATDVGTLNYQYRAYRTKENNGRKYVLGGYQNYGNIYTTNNNSVTRGGALRESFLAIADQGYSAHFPHSEMIVPFNNQLLSGRPNGSSGTQEFEIVHPQTQLGQPGYNTQAIKAAMYPYATDRQVSIAVMFNEMRWVGAYANIGVIAIEDANRAEDGVAGNVYLPNMSDSVLFHNTTMLNRKLLKCLAPFAASWNDAGWMAAGCDRWGRQVYRYSTAPTGTDFLREYGTQGDLWGDRGSLWIADTSMEKFQDDNGTEVLAANHVLSKPIGYTKNKARFGTQFPGSDL